MWFDPRLLELAESLKAAGRSTSFRPGARLARGFADVGFEEFVILPNLKMMSLFTGAQTEVVADHQNFFFEIPSLDDVLRELEERGEPVVEVEFKGGREWLLRTPHLSGKAGDLHYAGIECLLASYKV
jgi:hypothetical protein